MNEHPSIPSPDYWRTLAEQALKEADMTMDPETKEVLKSIAAGYEVVADRAEVARRKSEPANV